MANRTNPPSSGESAEYNKLRKQLKYGRAASCIGLLLMVAGLALVISFVSRTMNNVGYALMGSGLVIIFFAAIKTKALQRRLKLYQARVITNMTVMGYTNHGFVVSTVPVSGSSQRIPDRDQFMMGVAYTATGSMLSGGSHPGTGQYPSPGEFSSSTVLVPPPYDVPPPMYTTPPPSYTEAMQAPSPQHDHTCHDQDKSTSFEAPRTS